MFFGQKSQFCKFLTVLLVIRRKKKKIRHTRRHKLQLNNWQLSTNINLFFSATAKNKQYLVERLGITHLLNCAEGNKFGFCKTDKNFYKDTPIKYMGLPILDVPSTNISQYFFAAANFIEEAINSGGKFRLKDKV